MTMSPDPAPDERPALHHWGGFAVSGALAFATDATVLKLLTLMAGLHPILARLAAIAAAMVVAWLAHRTLTFAVKTPPTLAEFRRYAAVAWGVAGINYAVFSAIMLSRPESEPLIALVIASIVATVAAYFGMRFGVFRRH